MTEPMKPLWVAFPDLHPFSSKWRTGEGKNYIGDFWKWWDTAPEAASEKSRLAYVKASTIPAEWGHVALEMVWPENIPGDTFEFFFKEETGILRGALFKHGENHGLPSMAAWINALAKAVD